MDDGPGGLARTPRRGSPGPRTGTTDIEGETTRTDGASVPSPSGRPDAGTTGTGRAPSFEGLTITGFKSFPDTVRVDILPGMTGIVGPNGCGKSNVMDALRFVLGTTTANQLRGGVLDHLIFHGTTDGRGSTARPARNVAEVTLRVATDTGPGDVPATDGAVNLTRRVERGQGTTWRADGRSIKGGDARSFLRRMGSGAGSVAIIEQGRVKDLIDSKAGERRTLLEEAAGLGEVMVRRRTTAARLRDAAANLEGAEASLEDADKRLRSLRRQASAASKAAALDASVARASARVRLLAERDAVREARERDDEHRTAVEAEAEARATEAEATSAAERAEAVKAAARHARDAAHSTALVARERHKALADAYASAIRALERATSELDGARERSKAVMARSTDRTRKVAETEREAASWVEAVERAEADHEAAVADAERRRTEMEGAAAEAEASGRALAEAEGRAAASKEARASTERALERSRESLAKAQRERDEALSTAPTEGAATRTREAAIEATEKVRGAREAFEAAKATALEAEAVARDAEADAAAATGRARGVRERLASLSDDGDGDGDGGIVPREGWDTVLAGALAGARTTGGAGRWGPTPFRTVWPEGTRTLADVVETSPPGARTWLSSVAVAVTVGTDGLPVGGAIVDDDGGFTRWDGFVADGPSETARRAVALAVERRRLTDEAERAGREEAVTVRRAGDARTRATVLRNGADDLGRALEAAARTATHLDREASTAERVEGAARARTTAAEAAWAAAAGRVGELEADLRSLERAVEPSAELRDRAAHDRERAGVATLAAREAEATVRTTRAEVERARASSTSARREAEAARAAMEGDAREIAVLTATVPEAERRAAEARAAVPEDPKAAGEAEAEARKALAEADARMREAEAGAVRATGAAGDASRGAMEARETVVRVEVAAEAARDRAAEAAVSADGRDALLALAGDGWEEDDPRAVSGILERDRRARDAMGPVNSLAARQVEEEEERVGHLAAARDEVRTAVADLREALDELEEECRGRLHAAFVDLDRRFSEGFRAMYGGGEASLGLVGSDDVLDCSIEVHVAPPGKRSCPLSLLSGGERSLCALVLVLAAFSMAPAPVCVLDEVDAALSDVSCRMMCDAVRTIADEGGVRFLVVTHNSLSMSRMDRLVGVTMSEPGVSSVTTVDLDRAMGFAEVA